MATTYVFPSTQELNMIAQDKVATLVLEDPIFGFFPMRTKDTVSVAWEQRDHYFGLQQLRGLGGEPNRVKRLGAKRYVYEPGIYGEVTTLDEIEMLVRRQYGTYATPIDVSDLVMEAQDHLLTRRIERIRMIIWTLLTTGTFSIAAPHGGVQHTDTFAIQTYAGSGWSTAATGTPLADFRGAQLLSRGFSTSFGRDAVAFMNRATWNNLIKNTNAADLGGKRVLGGNTINEPGDVNRFLLDNDLPQIRIYDDGYYNDSNVFTLHIPLHKVVIVGSRPGNQVVGEYLMVRNAVNEGMAPGPYQKVLPRNDRVPPIVEIHDGHNGGPAIYFPSSVIVMTVS